MYFTRDEPLSRCTISIFQWKRTAIFDFPEGGLNPSPSRSAHVLGAYVHYRMFEHLVGIIDVLVLVKHAANVSIALHSRGSQHHIFMTFQIEWMTHSRVSK